MKISIGGQTISIGDAVLSFPMPRVGISGKNLTRDGQTFKVFGVQPLYHEWMFEYFTSGGDQERQYVIMQMEAARKFGANTLRIHLDLWTFISGTSYNDLAINATAFANFIHLLNAARDSQIYVLVSGNNTWHAGDVPAWYDALVAYADRWEVQAFFFEQLAQAVLDSGNSTTVLGYELMSEPTITHEVGVPYYWGDIYNIGLTYVQHIARGIPAGPTQAQVVRDWVDRLSMAIKSADADAKVTIGLISIGGGNYGPSNLNGVLDFLSPHLYSPEGLSTDLDIDLVTMWADSPLPIVVGESAYLNFNEQINRDWLDAALPLIQGFITFYMGAWPIPSFPSALQLRPWAPATDMNDQIAVIGYLLQERSMRLAVEYGAEFLGLDP